LDIFSIPFLSLVFCSCYSFRPFASRFLPRINCVGATIIGGEKPANANQVTIAFDPPIAPGQTVTVSLQAHRNPQQGGVYLFGVTAFPMGERNSGLFLGCGRVNIFDNQR
jgi:hypothetical protein